MNIERFLSPSPLPIETKKAQGGSSAKKTRRPVKKKFKAPPDRQKIKLALDKIIKNTRFQYIIKDEPNYFVVRIIDRDTDKVIREIPSTEMQKLHEKFSQLQGILFDKKI